MDALVKCYCISLKENEKERDACKKEFEKIGYDVEFLIVERSLKGGSHGCFTSHITVLKQGLESNTKYIMVTEDDVYFEYSDPDIIPKIFKFLETLNDQTIWCCCLGYFTDSPLIWINNHIIALEKCYCTHAYIVPRQTAERLINMEWKDVPYDMHWHDVIKVFYSPRPMIAFQRDRVSSISSGLGPYAINTIGFKNIARICEFWSSITC